MSENLITAIELLGIGWGGIFVIYLVSLALSKIFSPKSES